MKHLILSLLLLPALLFAQGNPLDIFRPLENYVWNAEGNWGDGSVFKQEITMKYSLDGKIVLVESKGFVNERNEFGLRNHGVRQFDETSGKI